MSTGIQLDEVLLGGGVLVRAGKLILTDAQIKALPTTAISWSAYFPAMGAGTRWIPIKGSWRAVIVAAYTNIQVNAKLRLVYGNNVWEACTAITDGASPAELSSLMATTGTRSVPLHEWDDQPHPAADAENLDIRVSIDNQAGGDWTGGNVGNSLTISMLAMCTGL